MKRILIINTAGLGIGGITTHMLNYIDRLKCEYSFTIIATLFYEEIVIKKLEEMGCRIVKLPHRKKQTVRYMSALGKVVRSGNWDAVHVHGNSATMSLELWMAKVGNVPVRIAHCHNTVCEHRFLHLIMKGSLGRLYTEAVACSDAAGEWIFGPGGYKILKNAVDAEKYAFNSEVRENYRKLFGVDKDTLLLGNIGNLVEQKNQRFLVPVMKRLVSYRKAVLVIIGEGEKEEELLAQIKNSGLERKITIYPYRSDISSCLQAFDCLMLPSKWEGLPLVLVEAQASGLPCVVADTVSEEAVFNKKYFKRMPLIEAVWVDFLKDFETRQTRQEGVGETRNAGYDMASSNDILRKIYDSKIEGRNNGKRKLSEN